MEHDDNSIGKRRVLYRRSKINDRVTVSSIFMMESFLCHVKRDERHDLAWVTRVALTIAGAEEERQRSATRVTTEGIERALGEPLGNDLAVQRWPLPAGNRAESRKWMVGGCTVHCDMRQVDRVPRDTAAYINSVIST